jgi:hypothetical protein
MMYCSFPNAQLMPFSIEYGPNMEEQTQALKARLTETTGTSPPSSWKAMIVYACGNGAADVESFVSTMQEALPEAAIIGGICSQGYVSELIPHYSKEELSQMSNRELQNLNQRLESPASGAMEKSELVDCIYAVLSASKKQTAVLNHVDDAIFGVVLGGEAPVRSMVSRGVRSVTYGTPQASSTYVAHDVILSRPGDDSFMFHVSDDLKPIHMIRQIRDTETGKIMPATELMAKISDGADFVGVQRPGQDGFELHMLSPYCQATQSYLIMTDGSPQQVASLENAQLDFFVLNGQACLEDMDRTVEKLQEQTLGEEILGAIMFSCSGRGPERGGLIEEAMADATRFAKGFPQVPCLGFYAGGEIGPLALAGNDNVFQTGRAAVQGFTAVFCLFIVPVLEQSPIYHLDDCRENVQAFFEGTGRGMVE